MVNGDVSEEVVELLRETADKIESGEATLSGASFRDGYGTQKSELMLEWWD